MKTSYRIKYTVTIKAVHGTMELADKEIIVHNHHNPFLAQVGLENYLNGKWRDRYVSMTVKSCEPIQKDPIEELLKGFNMN